MQLRRSLARLGTGVPPGDVVAEGLGTSRAEVGGTGGCEQGAGSEVAEWIGLVAAHDRHATKVKPRRRVVEDGVSTEESHEDRLSQQDEGQWRQLLGGRRGMLKEIDQRAKSEKHDVVLGCDAFWCQWSKNLLRSPHLIEVRWVFMRPHSPFLPQADPT
jgi:hypothetical protein